jgi:hypothetical protein
MSQRDWETAALGSNIFCNCRRVGPALSMGWMDFLFVIYVPYAFDDLYSNK